MSESVPTLSGKQAAWIAAIAIVIGALLGGAAQVVVETVKDRHEQTRLRAEHAEEIMTLAAQAPTLYLQIYGDVVLDPKKALRPPMEPERLAALVTLYFPNLRGLARDFEAACLNHFDSLQQLAMQQARGQPLDATTEKETFKRVYDTREALMAALSAEIGSRTFSSVKPSGRLGIPGLSANVAAMLEPGISIVAGAVLAIVITITVEMQRRPLLRMRLAATETVTYPPGKSPANTGQYLHIDLVNQPLPWLFRWMSRNAAMQCGGTMTFHNLDGGKYFAKAMPVRFSRSPQPIPLEIRGSGFSGILIDPSRLTAESRVDVYPGESTPFDVAVKFDSETECYGWSNLNYFCNPPWRHPDWKLPMGRYLVEVTIISSGAKCSGLFRLLNQGGADDFRVEKAQPTDKVI